MENCVRFLFLRVAIRISSRPLKLSGRYKTERELQLVEE